MNDYDDIGWDVPGWDWSVNDYSWLSSRSGLHEDEDDGGTTSVFFIHGGRVRHQAHLPEGRYSLSEFVALIERRMAPLEKAYVVWDMDTGRGNAGLWVEGTRPPNQDDIARLENARRDQWDKNERALQDIARRRSGAQDVPRPPASPS